MNSEAVKEILNELFSHLEKLETQSEAILQFLKEKKRVTDKQLAPYLEQAGNASNVRWRAARVRIERLLKPEHPEEEIKLGKRPELKEDLPESKRSESDDKEGKKNEPGDKNESAPAVAAEARPADSNVDKPEEKPEPEKSESGQKNRGQAAQDEQSDSVHHPTEVTEPSAQQEGAEPAAHLESKEKNSEKEAA
jgi:hypothetical protein